jgi:hypothetical protein
MNGDTKVALDTMWVLITAFLVFFMNAGFAMFESGLCRSKNAVNILAKNFVVFAVASLAFWLIGWALGWVFAATTVLWMLTGSEALRVIGTDLEISRKAAVVSRRKLFRGSDIKNITVVEASGWPMNNRAGLPFVMNGRDGSVRFDYGMRSYFLGAGLDPAEAVRVVDWLKQRLPHVSQ